jgi:hypothetical protein
VSLGAAEIWHCTHVAEGLRNHPSRGAVAEGTWKYWIIAFVANIGK